MPGPAAAGMAGIIGGAAAHVQNFIGEMSPAAVAQRREAKKALERLKTGQGYGMSGVEKNTARSEGNQQASALLAAQQAGLARMRAAGAASGGETTEANRAIAQEALGAQAQNEANVQAASNQQAQQEYANDMGLIDAEAARGRQAWAKQADISLQTTQGTQGQATAAVDVTRNGAPSRLKNAAGGGWDK
jgi:hypothetical protein